MSGFDPKSVEAKTSIYAHKNSIHNLNEKHQNEIEKIKIDHNKKKAQLENQHAQALFSARNNNQMELMEQAQRHEKTLEKMRDGLQETQERARQKEEAVSKGLDQRLSAEKIRFSEKLAQEKGMQKMAVEEMNQKANIELKRLQRQMDMENARLGHKARADQDILKSSSKNKLSISKHTYLQKQHAAENKYQRALSRQSKEQANVLASEERKFQKRLKERTDSYSKEIGKVQNDGNLKKAMAKSVFEKKFRDLLNEHESTLGELAAKKETIVQNLRNEIIEAHKLDVQRASDPFYTPTSLDPKITEEDGAYVIALEVHESDAGNVNLNGHKRDLTLSLNRRYENTSNDKGAVEKIKKVETLTRNFKVEKIVDPSKTQKSYSDGVLTFRIGHA